MTAKQPQLPPGHMERDCNGSPPLGWSTKCFVKEVYDGDTVVVTVTREIRVRLLDCWSPEVRTRDAAEKARGLAARDYLRDLAEGQQGRLFVPTESSDELGDAFTFGRALGHIWLPGDPMSLSAHQRRVGHATATKGGK